MPWMPVWLAFWSMTLPALRSMMSSVLLLLLATNRRSRLTSMATWSRPPALRLLTIVCTSSSSLAGAALVNSRAVSVATAARHEDFMRVLSLVGCYRSLLDGHGRCRRRRRDGRGLHDGGGRLRVALDP